MVERRDTGINEGRLSGVAADALECGRGICEGDFGSGSLRSDNRGVEGRDCISPSAPTTTQLSAVRNRLVIRGRSGRSSMESMDLTP
jgi:hypothetical protein